MELENKIKAIQEKINTLISDNPVIKEFITLHNDLESLANAFRILKKEEGKE
ncbi:hypothetical protein QUR06_000257 [Escherichia coli]|nr:hypothetical protein [Escherichia coli]